MTDSIENKQLRRSCPCCQSQAAYLIGEKCKFDLLICHRCQTLFTSRLPLASDGHDYDNYYSDLNLNIPSFIYKRLEEIIHGFSQFRVHNRLLDVGFGAGTILQAAKGKGWQTFGVEISKPAIENAKALGFDVFHGELSEANYPDEYFDVITASEILEHLPEPVKLLEEVAKILRPGGLFWATTPSSKSLSYKLMGLNWSAIGPPDHLQLFSRKGIYSMLKKAGFSQIKIYTHGLNPGEIIYYFRPEKRGGGSSEDYGFSRVETGYKLNESLTKSTNKKKIKNLLNSTLNFLQIGDSLKIFAQK